MPTSSMMTKRMLGVRESSGRSLLSLPPEELELSLQDANPPSIATNTTTATSRIADISCFLVVSPQYVGRTLKAQAVEKGISWVILVAFNRSTLSQALRRRDRKSTRLNSSHVRISYAVFCLKKKKK